MYSGIRFENHNNELSIVKDGGIIISAESLYSIVLDLLAVNCSLPEDWPQIRQKFDKIKNTYEISIGAESEKQLTKEIIENEEYINGLREGEYFLQSIVNPHKFIDSIKNKLIRLGLVETEDFHINYNRRLGRITLYFTG